MYITEKQALALGGILVENPHIEGGITLELLPNGNLFVSDLEDNDLNSLIIAPNGKCAGGECREYRIQDEI